MRLPLSIAALALAAAPAMAQNMTSNSTDFAIGLVAALTAGGFNTLVSVVSKIGATSDGLNILSKLQSGKATLLAPTDGAWSGVSENIMNNMTLLADVLQYHVLDGNYTAATVARAPAHTIARTALTGSEFANLPGGRGQAIVLYKGNGTNMEIDAPYRTWEGHPYNISTYAPTTYRNLTIVGTGQVKPLPPTISEFALKDAPLSAALLATANLIGPIQALKGITVFLPTDIAVAALGSNVNSSALETILNNHVVNNTVVYSTTLTNSTNAISLAGEKFTFGTNSAGGANGNGTMGTVTSGNVTANIVFSDVIISNGVVHIIDRVLENTASNPQAVQSIASVAATASSTSDAGVGPTSSASRAVASASASASARAGSGAAERVGGGGKAVVLAAVVGAVAVMWA